MKSISRGLEATQKRLFKAGLEAEVTATRGGDEIKLFIRRGRHQVKVEARRLFTTELTVPLLAAPEPYSSKLVAAMDRQHPRAAELTHSKPRLELPHESSSPSQFPDG